MTGIIWKLFENKPENIIKLACKNSQDAQKLHARLIALPLEVMETWNKILRKPMMLVTDTEWFSWKTFWWWSCLLRFRPGKSCSPQAPPGIQHRAVLCYAETPRKMREWLGHCSMSWSEMAGCGSRINCKIGWFLDSFYCCTFIFFFILLQVKQKGTK